MITKIELKNFKSFIDEKLDLGPETIIIGNNATGKSNLIDAFKLVQDSYRYGLDNAYYLHGGFNSVFPRYVGVKPEKDKSYITRVSIEQGYERGQFTGISEKVEQDKPSVNTYVESTRLDLYYIHKGQYDSQKYKYTIEYKVRADGPQAEEYSYSVCLDFTNQSKKFSIDYRNLPEYLQAELRKKEEKGPIDFISKEPKSLEYLSLMLNWFSISSIWLRRKQDELVSFYDFNSQLVKMSTKFAGDDLAEDGRNYAFILRDILKSSTKKKDYITLVHKLLPDVESFKTSVTTDGNLSVSFKERLSRWIPGHNMSDGMAYMLALLAAIVTGPHGRTLFFEEPDRYLHPGLARKLVSVLNKSADGSRMQIIVTTHNQEFLKYVDSRSVKVIRRNKLGQSNIVSVLDDERIAKLIERGEDLNSLFVNLGLN